MSTSDDTAAEKLESICPGCGERNPPQFALCWNCGASLENAEKTAAIEEPDEDDAQKQIEIVASDSPFGRWTGWYELTAVLLLAFVDRFVILLVYYGWNRSRDITFDAVAYLTYLPYYIGLSMLLWTLVRRDREIKQPLALNKCNWGVEIAFALAIVFANMLIVRFVGAFAMQIEAPAAKKTHEAITHTAITGANQWAVSLVYWFCVALFEEFLYRVYLQSKFESLFRNTPLAILLSAALFAISHGYPWPGTLQVFATGVLFGTIYSCSHRVPRIVLAHWIYDLLLVFLQQR